MSDLLRKGSQWLEQMREKHCSSPVRYEHDSETVEVNATYGKTDYQLASDAGINVGSHVWDFMILSDALPFEPEPGDIIEADGIWFEVMPLGVRHQRLAVERSVSGDLQDSHQGDRQSMTECRNMIQCEKHFEVIHEKLDRLDEAVRGNGKPGIQLRLDRLEAAERSRSRLLWLIAGAALTLAVNTIWARLAGG
ncbi:MAG TPA: hypothetical protein VM487_10885 [Phycisphaerae bacterium]|nr:hypothetical protein [Phycisphaerae bacterium]